MKYSFYSIMLLLLTIGCNNNEKQSSKYEQQRMTQNDIKNEQLKVYSFLKDMYSDSYFPNFLVDKGKAILVELCIEIEQDNPTTLDELYKLTHAATNKFNDLEDEFGENDSEIETAAREAIAVDFEFIAKAFKFDADIEELIATRDW